MSRFSIGTLSSQITEKLRKGTLLCSKKFLVSKKIWIRRREGAREGRREGGREGRSEGGSEGGREGVSQFLSRN